MSATRRHECTFVINGVRRAAEQPVQNFGKTAILSTARPGLWMAIHDAGVVTKRAFLK
jgi:hypothetical protein